MANRSLGVLTLDLIAKTGGFTGPIDKAARDLDRQTKGMSKSLDGFASSLKTIGAGIAGFVSGAAIAGFAGLAVGIQRTVDSMDELSKSAQKVGLTTEELSKLAYAGDLADVSLETLVSSLGKLTKAQAAALDTSSKTAEVFEALGIAVKNADGSLRSSSDVLADFAQRFQELGGSPEAVAAGFQIFGRSFQELIPLLKDGRQGIQDAGDELQRFGGVISTEAGQAAEEFNDNLTRLKTQFAAIFAQVAQQLLPTLVKLSEDLGGLAKSGDLARNATSLLNAALEIGVGILNLYNKAVDNTSIAIEQAIKSYEGWTEITRNVGSLGFASGSVVEGINKIRDATNEAADARERLANTPAAVESRDGIDFSRGAPLSADEQAAGNKRLQVALAGVNEEKKKGAKATKELTEAEKAWRDIMEVNEIIDEESRKAQEQIRRDRQDRADDFAALIGDIQTQNSLLGQTEEQQDLINTARQYGIDLASEEGRILSETLASYHENRKAIEDQVAAMDALKGSFTDFLTDVKEGKGVWDSLKNAVDSFADTLFQLAASNIAEQIFGQSGTTGGGASGDFFANILGAFFGGGRATGGSVRKGQFYEVNENGTELLTVGGRDYLMMGSNGTVTPSPQVGGGSFVANFNYAAPYDARTEEQKLGRLEFELGRARRREGR